MSSKIEVARRYLKIIESGNASELNDLFSPDATFEQLPNRIYPNGLRSNISRMEAAFEKGRQLFSSQKYEIINSAESASCVSLEVLWIGKLAVAFGNLVAGSEMRAHCAMFLDFVNGKIVAQRNYDCFEPW